MDTFYFSSPAPYQYGLSSYQKKFQLLLRQIHTETLGKISTYYFINELEGLRSLILQSSKDAVQDPTISKTLSDMATQVQIHILTLESHIFEN
jgi:hypothetical protein